VGLHANGGHDTGQLDGNVTRTHDSNLGRKLLDLKEPVAGDTMLGALDGGNGGPATGRNENVRCRVPRLRAVTLRDLDDLGLDEPGAAVHEIDAFLAPVSLVGTVQTLDDGVPRFLEMSVVDLDVLDGDVIAVVLANMESFVDGSEIPGHLLGDAAAARSVSISPASLGGTEQGTDIPDVDASTTRPSTLHNQRLRTVPASGTPCAAATTTTTTQNDIVILLDVRRSHLGRVRSNRSR
jgi:hypothetical protein